MTTITDTKRPAHRPSKMPADTELKDLYATMTQPELATRYGVSIRTVARWLRLAGISKDGR